MEDGLGILLDWPLHGRTEELAFVGERIAAGDPGVLITGGAGVGKSRLAREVVAFADGQGRPTDLIVCTRATADLPYGVLSPLVGFTDGASPFDRALTELRERSERTVLAVDNLDRLDRMSLAVVQQAIVEGLVFLVGTLRTGERARGEVAALWRDLGVVRIELQPLSRREVAGMLTAGLGGEVDGVAARRIFEASAGVPLFVRELAIEAYRHEILVSRRGVWMLTGPLPAPSSLPDLLGVRLDALDEAARRAAEVLAVAESLPSTVLLGLASFEAVDSLESAGIVRVVDGDYRFTHPLFGELVGESMSMVRRRRVMAELADAVNARGQPGDLIRVATWRLESGVEASASLLGDAAHASYRLGDFDLARRLAEAAGALGSSEGTLLLGQILHEAGEHRAAEELNRRFRPDDLAPPLARRVAVQRAVNLFFGLGRGDDALAVLEQNPEGLPFNRAWLLINMGRLSEAEEVLPAEHPDRVSLLVTAAWVSALAGRPDDALACVERLRHEPRDPSLPPGRFRDFPDLPRTLALLEAGRPGEALEVAEQGLEESVERHPSFIRSWWLFLLGRIHTDLGRMATAVSFFRRGEVLRARTENLGLMAWYLGGAAYATVQTTDPSEVGDLLARVEAVGDRDERLFRFLSPAAGLWDSARRSARGRAAAGLIALGDREASHGSMAAARRLWFDAVRLGGARKVEERLDGGSSEFDRVRAGLARALRAGDADQVGEAASWFAASGLSLWAAEAWTWAVTMWTRRGEPRRASAAARFADAARARCDDVDTPGLAAERGPAPLTDREREVVGLAARQMTSRQIAEALTISVRTVDNLLQRAYVKLGVSSRREAAVALGIELAE